MLLHRAGKDHDLDRALKILELEYRHQVALAGPLALQVGDHPADLDDRSVWGVGQPGHPGVGLAPNLRLETEQRMVGDVEAEHLLFVRKARHLLELDIRNRRSFVEGRAIVEFAEQRHDPHVVLLTALHRQVDDLLVHLQQTLPGMTEAVERATLDQRLDRALVERLDLDPLDEIDERLEGATLVPGSENLLDDALTDVPDRRHSEDDAARGGAPLLACLGVGATVPVGVGHRREVHFRPVDVGHLDVDAHEAALVEIHRCGLELALHRRQQCRQVLDRMVRLEVGDLVRHIAVAVGVRLVEGVVGELRNDVEHLDGERLVVALVDHTGGELLPLLLHRFADLLAHRLAEGVRLGE